MCRTSLLLIGPCPRRDVTFRRPADWFAIPNTQNLNCPCLTLPYTTALYIFCSNLKTNATKNLFGRDLSVRVVILLSCLSSVPTTDCKEEDNKLFAPRTRSPLGNNLRTRTLDNKRIDRIVGDNISDITLSRGQRELRSPIKMGQVPYVCNLVVNDHLTRNKDRVPFLQEYPRHRLLYRFIALLSSYPPIRYSIPTCSPVFTFSLFSYIPRGIRQEIAAKVFRICIAINLAADQILRDLGYDRVWSPQLDVAGQGLKEGQGEKRERVKRKPAPRIHV
ncbi:hypothetical protein KQX54_002136 [Cotesia glomerata]|uniref:Uncharacterized protein n=1 Tax=Cotesia glomerata TaxID=32391 RepID=A0AAV7I6H9_COTGL|nr:hypothetical protein KQX54_002136 [Cotesia glomerata]